VLPAILAVRTAAVFALKNVGLSAWSGTPAQGMIATIPRGVHRSLAIAIITGHD
jgi:hypothetical protein